MNAQSDGLRGTHVVVVGASSGIGRAVSVAAAMAGASVTMASRSLERLEAARREVPGETTIAALDMLDETSVIQFFESAGPFDHLVITAVADEVALHSPFASMTTEIARRSLDKLWGTFFVARAASTSIARGGSMTLTSSIAAFSPPQNGGYAMMNAASAGVAALARSLAAELRPIRVNAIAPGTVDSGVWAGLGSDAAASFRTSAAETLPVGHLGRPDELAHAVLYLMTNTYTTGTVLVVDGGAILT
jgi:NAD(P)-dependent dehydrogenase (short-subunit alcohol dehydrogenase family)